MFFTVFYTHLPFCSKIQSESSLIKKNIPDFLLFLLLLLLLFFFFFLFFPSFSFFFLSCSSCSSSSHSHFYFWYQIPQGHPTDSIRYEWPGFLWAITPSDTEPGPVLPWCPQVSTLQVGQVWDQQSRDEWECGSWHRWPVCQPGCFQGTPCCQ